MAIEEPRILGQDCEITVGDFDLLQFTNWELTLRKNKKDSRTAASGREEFVEPYRGATLRVRGLRGLAETLKDLEVLFEEEEITAITGTDLPNNLITKYGKPSVISLAGSQDEGEGQYDFQIDFGKISHGYTPVV